jgi:hypothetical protein
VDTRKSLAGEFRLHGKTVFVVANHFSSKGADDPLFGRVQPPIRASEPARHAQAQVVNDFVDQLVVADPRVNVIVLGDINDFEFSQTVQLLEGGVLTTLMATLAKAERYSSTRTSTPRSGRRSAPSRTSSGCRQRRCASGSGAPRPMRGCGQG